MNKIKNSRILIAGLGLIGGSVAKALKMAGCPALYAFDDDANTLDSAIRDGVIQKGFIKLSGKMPTFDIIICCLLPRFIVSFYEDIKLHLKPGGVFAELSGLKTNILNKLSCAAKNAHQILSLHPMAGSEKSGYAYSDATLFNGSMLILTPTDLTKTAALCWAQYIKTVLGCSDMRELSAELHDEIITKVSHIPHIAALAIRAMGKGIEHFAGGSYRAVTRVADINSTLWAGLMTDNREYLLNSISLFKQIIDVIEDTIKKGDEKELKKLLDEISE
ncbi:MAG: prephenate dehydrogenase [Christensenellales bacterium]|jgi:prephenate dehydrogenase